MSPSSHGDRCEKKEECAGEQRGRPHHCAKPKESTGREHAVDTERQIPLWSAESHDSWNRFTAARSSAARAGCCASASPTADRTGIKDQRTGTTVPSDLTKGKAFRPLKVELAKPVEIGRSLIRARVRMRIDSDYCCRAGNPRMRPAISAAFVSSAK